MSTKNAIINEDNRVIIYDELAKSVIIAMLGYAYDDDEAVAEAKFSELFEIVKPDQKLFFADPADSFYQGVNAIAVIRRKSDGTLFGFQYWTPIAKYGEPSFEPNGDDHGLEFDVPDGFDWENDYYPEPFVFLPVEPFTITGYKITAAK